MLLSGLDKKYSYFGVGGGSYTGGLHDFFVVVSNVNQYPINQWGNEYKELKEFLTEKSIKVKEGKGPLVG